MAYDKKLALRLTKAFSRRKGAVEKKMFGGIAYMVKGHMCCGVVDDLLMLRIGPDAYHEALKEKHTRPMDFTGRPMKGYIYVEPRGFKTDEALKSWIERGIKFVRTLPPKSKK